jgi:hypothetical protein
MAASATEAAVPINSRVLLLDHIAQCCAILRAAGEKGTVPEGHTGAGQQYSLKGAPFYRIIHGFIDQAGVEVDSVFGGQFKDDPGGLRLKHDHKVRLPAAAAAAVVLMQ